MCRDCRLYSDYLQSIGFDMGQEAVSRLFHEEPSVSVASDQTVSVSYEERTSSDPKTQRLYTMTAEPSASPGYSFMDASPFIGSYQDTPDYSDQRSDDKNFSYQ